MTEQEWLTCTDPKEMLHHLWECKGSGRKVRLFAVACCRRIWPLLTDERSRQAVETAERYADGVATNKELKAARAAARAASYPDWEAISHPVDRVRKVAQEAARLAASASFSWPAGIDASHAANYAAHAGDAKQLQATLLRDLIGNPFRAASIDASWLSWQDGTVRRMAPGIYEERRMPEGTLDNARLAVLADALEESGCTDPDMLAHLRGPGPHVRGCWVLDLLLGKK
jgi:hypothetical protein